MVVVKNVLIEIDQADMPFTDFVVPVYKNFKQEKYLGYAELELRENRLYADFYLSNPVGNDKLWPAIGYQQNPDRIHQIGLCSNPNVDANINPVHFEMLS